MAGEKIGNIGKLLTPGTYKRVCKVADANGISPEQCANFLLRDDSRIISETHLRLVAQVDGEFVLAQMILESRNGRAA